MLTFDICVAPSRGPAKDSPERLAFDSGHGNVP